MASWQAIFREIGAEVTTIRLLDRRAGAKDLRRLPALLASSAVPEALVWSETEGRRRLEDLQPDLTLFVTARAWSPSFDVGRPVLLDYVDRLSQSYRQRSRLNSRVDNRSPCRDPRSVARSIRASARRGELDRGRLVGYRVALGATWGAGRGPRARLA